jgi:hypothetical protein
MRLLRRAANTLSKLAGRRHWRRFARALAEPRRTQERILIELVRRNAATAWGRRHGYAAIDSVESFRERVPVTTWDALEPWIDRIRGGEPGVLTAEPVLLLERTSGSTGAAKDVPYTASLLAEFRRAVGAWTFDLLAGRPALLGGPHYWSVTPLARPPERTPGGLRVGLASDREYLGPLERLLARLAAAVPDDVARDGDVERCLRLTAARLARRRDLRLISVWSPSLLTLLAGALPEGRRPAELWPDLALISCWTDGASRRLVPELEALFPGVEIQGKGLLATEGVVSFPVLGEPAPLPAITSHFLEFAGDDGRPRLADELEPGETYEVLITTGGGLARYALGDLVRAVERRRCRRGRRDRLPAAVEFVGRRGRTSDLCGEKLDDAFVGAAIEGAMGRLGIAGAAMLAPEWDSPPRYVLLVESERAAEAAALVEERLRASYHYDYCRRLGQLAAVEGVAVSGAGAAYLRGCAAGGRRAGDVKPAWLLREPGWRERMAEGAGLPCRR